MAIAAPRPCAQPGCAALVDRGQSRCLTHMRARHREDRERRGSAHDRGYDSRWRRYREHFLRANPLCVECQPAIVPATVVDHIKPHKGDTAKFWDKANHRAVCKPCHDKRVDEGDFGRPQG